MKILISDLDGTLVNENTSISPKNIEALKELKKQGHLIASCTGRNFMEVKELIDCVDFSYDYLILNNGGQILDKNLTTLYEKHIDHEIGVDILKHLTSYAGMWAYYCDGHVNYGYIDGQTINHGAKGKPKIDVDFHQAYQQASHFQIIAFNQDDEGIENTKACYDYILENYSDSVEAYFNMHFVDVVPKGCSKGSGIKKLLTLIEEDIDEVYAIGDSYNDLSMIQSADYGYTFIHAHDDIKSQTKRHVHYVYEVIEDMLGGNKDELAK